MFEINKDLDNIRYKDWHNWFHLFATMFIGYIMYLFGNNTLTSVLTAYGIGVLWEIGDGFKPWYYNFRPSGNKFKDWFVSNLCYSNKFSLQDVFVWDLGGAAILLLLLN